MRLEADGAQVVSIQNSFYGTATAWFQVSLGFTRTQHDFTTLQFLIMKPVHQHIEANAKNNCLILHYDIGNDEVNQKHFQQTIKISKPANKNVELQRIARKIMQKCDIIPESRFNELVSALIQLNRNGLLSSTPYYEYPLSLQSLLVTNNFTVEKLENFDETKVSIKHLDSYIELLYDELEDKIKGAFSILKLINTPEHVSILSKNDTLLCALSRVLREDGKKSLDLAICICSIFCHFSKYIDFHFAISNYKAGSTSLELIYYEILREESWSKELSQKKLIAESQLENLNAKLSYEKLLISYQSLIKKQNIFFRYALYVLLNISEDIKLEYKIAHKGIISILIKLLDRNSQDLLLIIVIYLKKLSVFIQNKLQMKELKIYKSINSLLYLDNELLIYNTLKLLYNLMIDHEIRTYFIRSGIFSKLVSFFLKGHFMSVIVSIFYLISCEAKYLVVFKNYPNLITMLLDKMLQDVPYKCVLYNLLTNLATNYHLAQLIVEYNDFSEIIKMILLESNLSLIRFCRNISCHQNDLFRLTLISYQDNLIELMIKSIEKSSLLVECAAILTNLASIEQVDWLALYQHHSILDFLLKLFQANNNAKKSSAVQYALHFVAATAQQMAVTAYLAQNGLPEHLLQLINDNQENDEVVLSCVYCFYVLIQTSREIRSKIWHETKLVDYLFELMYDRNYQIKTLCTRTLDLISEDEPELQQKIKLEKFNAYNSKWLNMIQNERSSEETSHSLLEDMFIYPDLFLKMDILNDSSSENFSDDNQPMEHSYSQPTRPNSMLRSSTYFDTSII